MIRFRRFVSFAILLPVWPIALVAAIVDDESKVIDVVESFKATWSRINEE